MTGNTAASDLGRLQHNPVLLRRTFDSMSSKVVCCLRSANNPGNINIFTYISHDYHHQAGLSQALAWFWLFIIGKKTKPFRGHHTP